MQSTIDDMVSLQSADLEAVRRAAVVEREEYEVLTNGLASKIPFLVSYCVLPAPFPVTECYSQNRRAREQVAFEGGGGAKFSLSNVPS